MSLRSHKKSAKALPAQCFRRQIKIPATYMRGGTSKGVFFCLEDLPEFAQTPGPKRDQLLLRVIGSPDPYEKHIDGMGGASSSTSKTVIVAPSDRPDHDVDYYFGQVAIDKPMVDWSGNCGNLSAAVGAFAIHRGLVDKSRIPDRGSIAVRIWQANINQTIITHIPINDGKVQETGDFELDGVTFPAAEIPVEFLDPAVDKDDIFPTGNLIDQLNIPGIGQLEATFINVGIATIFLRADELGYSGTELQDNINKHPNALEKFETIRAYGAVQMGLINNISEATHRQHTPKIAFIGPAQTYTAANGRTVLAKDIDCCIRALSMGKLHHAMMGTAAVAIAAAAAIPGTLVNTIARTKKPDSICFGHPSGKLTVGAETENTDGKWLVKKAIMSRSSRILMEGWVSAHIE
ncbi:MAG: 2-methylaconitate cis-trans isomerase PrpF [Pseudomonadota bacterium]